MASAPSAAACRDVLPLAQAVINIWLARVSGAPRPEGADRALAAFDAARRHGLRPTLDPLERELFRRLRRLEKERMRCQSR
jgi:hypothetical protein